MRVEIRPIEEDFSEIARNVEFLDFLVNKHVHTSRVTGIAKRYAELEAEFDNYNVAVSMYTEELDILTMDRVVSVQLLPDIKENREWGNRLEAWRREMYFRLLEISTTLKSHVPHNAKYDCIFQEQYQKIQDLEHTFFEYLSQEISGRSIPKSGMEQVSHNKLQ
jgi:hypothetical protein